MFSMLGIVLATNFFEMFIFWELVGLSSYLLIGFWYDRPAAADPDRGSARSEDWAIRSRSN